MSAAVNDADSGESARQTGQRDAGFALGDDEYLIYDTENNRAWIQSDRSCPLEETR